MVMQVMGENSNRVSKFLPLFIFRNNFQQDNNQVNIYQCFANKRIDIFILLLKIDTRKKRAYHKFVLFVSIRILRLFKE